MERAVDNSDAPDGATFLRLLRPSGFAGKIYAEPRRGRRGTLRRDLRPSGARALLRAVGYPAPLRSAGTLRASVRFAHICWREKGSVSIFGLNPRVRLLRRGYQPSNLLRNFTSYLKYGSPPRNDHIPKTPT